MVGKSNTLKKEAKEHLKPPPVDARVLRVVHTMVSKANTSALDRLIHERVRLGIISVLAVNESLTFNELKKYLKTSDGNLSVHARKLEEARYIACTKSFDGRMPKTEYRITAEGRQALERYLSHMEALIQAMRQKEGEQR